MKKIKKKFNSLRLFLISITTFFSIIFFLSIPVLYNYESIQKEIEKEFLSEFDIELEILGKISRNNFPQPHLIIKNANLKLINENSEGNLMKVNELKIIIPYKDFFLKSNFKIQSAVINNSNLKFRYVDFKNFRDHLYYKINKPILIKNSKFFYLDKNDETILISLIDDLNYSINEKKNSKEFRVMGNIFDTNFKSMWTRSYDKPFETRHEVKFKNPNLIYKSIFNKEKLNNFSGIGSVKFLDEKIEIKYLKKKDSIILDLPIGNEKQNIKVFANIELNPFYFDSKIILIKKNFNFVIENFFYLLFNLDSEHLGNLNGDLEIILKNLDNDIINNGNVKISINENTINKISARFEIENIGIINSEFFFKEENNEKFFISKNVLKIQNKKQFAKKFQLNTKRVQNINFMDFNLEKSFSSNEIYLSNIKINEKSVKEINEKIYKVKSLNEFKFIMRKILIN